MSSFDDFIKESTRKMREDMMHRENIQVQRDLIASNNKISDEISGVKSSLQEQIDINKADIQNGKVKDKKLSVRGWIQFGITTGIALGALVVSIIALCLRF